MRKRVLIVAMAIAALFTGSALADDFPSRPVTMVAPFPPGGPTDMVARIMAERMKVTLGQGIIVENITGAGGTIGMGRVARGAADGYTVAVGNWTNQVGSGAIYSLPFDVLNDLEPVSLLTTSHLLILGKNDLPASNLKDLIAWVKAGTGKVTAGTVGVGSAAHMCLLYFQNSIDAKFQFVPYRGGAPALQDLVAGQIDVSCLEAASALPFVRGGKMKAFAVMAKDRWFGAPEIPTVDEAGAPGLHMPFWHGLWAPKGTPKEVIAKLNAAVVEAFADPGVREKFAKIGHDIPPREQQTPQALYAHHKADIDKWWPIIKAANIKVEGN
jgi:tripartite-type tricarboxylate transporter receptor subunit TctC